MTTNRTRIREATGATTTLPAGRRPAPGLWPLRLLAAAGLLVDAAVHGALAGRYDPIRATLGEGDVFRIETGLAALAALGVLLLVRSRLAWAFAFLVAATACGAAVLYGTVDVGAFWPVPDMYDPSWSPGQLWSAVAEGVAALAALAGLALHQQRLARHDREPR
jgi:hypothetical protein